PTTSQPQRKQKTKKTRIKDTELPQTSKPTEVDADEAVYEEMYDSVERAVTTATGLDANSGSRPRHQETMRDAAAQTRVLALETTKTNQALEIGSLKRRVKKLEKKASKRTHKLSRLYKIGVLDDEEVVAEKEVSTADPVTTVGEVVTTIGVEVSTVATTHTISIDDITLAKALAALKSAKRMVKEQSVSKAKGIVMQKPEETTIRITTTVPSQSSKDSGKAKMIKLKKPLKKKDQIMIDEEVARNLEAQLQAKLEEEERLARQKEKEAYIALIAEWDDLKNKSFKEVQKAFENTISWINLFVPRAGGSSKRVGEELEFGKSKKQKLDEQVEVEEDNDQEEAEIKMYMKIIFDDEIAIDAIPLATKPLIIGKYGNTRPEEAYERVLWGDLKVMFEPDIEIVENMDVYRDEEMGDVIVGEPFCKDSRLKT
nr:hypothetical protein [Tanacetum cinerariifolium]